MDYVVAAGQSIGWLVFYGMFILPISATIVGMAVDGCAEVFVY